MGLYSVRKQDLSAITHSYNPIAEKNGFNQVPRRKRSLRPLTRVDFGLSDTVQIDFNNKKTSTLRAGDFGASTTTVTTTPSPTPNNPFPQPVVTVLKGNDAGILFSPKVTPSKDPSQPATITPALFQASDPQAAASVLLSGQPLNFQVPSTPAAPVTPAVVTPVDAFLGQPGQSRVAIDVPATFQSTVSTPVGFESSVAGSGRSDIAPSGGGLYALSKSNADPHADDKYDDQTGLSSWFTKKVMPAVKKAVKKAAVIQVSGITGAASGFITSGFNPLGAVAGGVAGATKGVVDATKTSNPHLTTKNIYQSAAYGGGAGAVVGVSTATSNAITNAQRARSAAMAAKVGYGAAADTAMAAGTYVPVGEIPSQASLAATLFGTAKSVATSPYVAVPLTARLLASKSSDPGAVSTSGEGVAPSTTNIFTNPGNPLSLPGTPTGGGYSTASGGGSYPLGVGTPDGQPPIDAGASSATGQAPDAGGYAPENAQVKKSAVPLLATAALVAFFVIRKNKRKAA